MSSSYSTRSGDRGENKTTGLRASKPLLKGQFPSKRNCPSADIDPRRDLFSRNADQSLLAGLLSPPLLDSGVGELGFVSASAAFLYESLR